MPRSGMLDGAAGRLDHQHGHGLGALDPPHRAARQDQVVALVEREVAVVAEQIARAGVDEQQLVAVAVAREMVHVAIGVPEAQLDVGVVQHRRRLPGLRARCSLSLARSKARGRSGPSQLVQPVGGCLWYIMRRRAEEAFLAQLALERALGQVGVRLARRAALDARKGDVIAGHVSCPLL